MAVACVPVSYSTKFMFDFLNAILHFYYSLRSGGAYAILYQWQIMLATLPHLEFHNSYVCCCHDRFCIQIYFGIKDDVGKAAAQPTETTSRYF